MLSCVITDIGTTKNVNQDAIFCKNISINEQRCTFGCVCDGLGGLSGGEIASSNAVRSLTEWFIHQYPYIYLNENDVQNSLKSCVLDYNKRLYNYSQSLHKQMGTTVSGIVLSNDRYLTVNTGDSRTYLLRDRVLKQLTKDHSFVQREIDAGRMTIEESKTSNTQNVLTYCVGFANQTVVDFTTGYYQSDDVFFFCSDGARHVIEPIEFVEFLSGISSKDMLKERLTSIVSLCKERGERDNISIGAIVI